MTIINIISLSTDIYLRFQRGEIEESQYHQELNKLAEESNTPVFKILQLIDKPENKKQY